MLASSAAAAIDDSLARPLRSGRPRSHSPRPVTYSPRCHASRFPQALYLSTIVTSGVLTIAVSMWHVAVTPVGLQWLILAVLTVLSGAAVLRIPTAPISFSISDSFTITAALLFGPAVGTLTVVIDSLVISFRLTRRALPWRHLFFNATAPALAMWTAAHGFFLMAGVGPLAEESAPLGQLVWPLVTFASLYFVLNTGLIAGAVALEQHASLVATWRHHFFGLWLTYFGGAAVAALLIVLENAGGLSVLVLAVIAAIPLILYVTFKNGVGRMEDQLAHLQQVNRNYLATIETLAHAIDAKDQVTHGHIRRVQQYAVRLAEALGVDDEAQIRAIEAASLLHDLGKLAVPEHILNKPGPLTPTEFDKMKRHAAVGADILSSIDFPYPVVPIVRHHHEHWSGTGYPAGLKGEAIPLGARILAVVDCFDALTSDRPYRPKLSTTKALAILLERSGTMYDPRVVAEFLEIYRDLSFEPDSVPAFDALGAITRTSHADVGPYSDDAAPQDPEPFAVFYDLGRDLAAAPDGALPTNQVHRALQRLMPAACTAIYAYHRAEDNLIARWVAGQYAPAIQGLSIPLGQRVTGWVAASQSTIRNSDAALDLGNLTMKLVPAPQRCLSTSICVDGALVGALTIYSESGEPFRQVHATLAQALASRLGPLVQRAVQQAGRDGIAE